MFDAASACDGSQVTATGETRPDLLGSSSTPFCVRCGQHLGAAWCQACAEAHRPIASDVRLARSSVPRLSRWRLAGGVALLLAVAGGGVTVSIAAIHRDDAKLDALRATQSRSIGEIAKLRQTV